MNFTVSQWLQIIAVAVSAAISISRWVWDAKRIKADIHKAHPISDINDKVPRIRVGWDTRFAFFAPLAVLIWQTFRGGSLTRFDFGIMVLSAVLFLGFVSIRAAQYVMITIQLQEIVATSFKEAVDRMAKIAEMSGRLGRLEGKMDTTKKPTGQQGGDDNA